MTKQFKTLQEFLQDFDVQYKAGAFGTPVDDEQESELKCITLDLPLFIRLLEFSREEAKDDIILHVIAENAEKMMADSDCLVMSDYDALLGKNKMKLIDIKQLAEASVYKIGPEWDYVLEEILAGKRLTGLHYTLLAKLLFAWKKGWILDKVTVAEATPCINTLAEVKALSPEQIKEMARNFHNATHWPNVMWDYFPTYNPLGLSRVMGMGSE